MEREFAVTYHELGGLVSPLQLFPHRHKRPTEQQTHPYIIILIIIITINIITIIIK